MDDSIYVKAREAAVKHIGISVYSSGSIRDFLLRKDFPYEVVVSVVKELVERKYIDDNKACHKILYQRTGKKQESKDFMLKRLLAGGVDEYVAEDYIYALPADSVTILSLFDAVISDGDDLDSPEVRESLCDWSRKRGYSFECFAEAYREWISTHNDSQ